MTNAAANAAIAAQYLTGQDTFSAAMHLAELGHRELGEALFHAHRSCAAAMTHRSDLIAKRAYVERDPGNWLAGNDLVVDAALEAEIETAEKDVASAADYLAAINTQVKQIADDLLASVVGAREVDTAIS